MHVSNPVRDAAPNPLDVVRRWQLAVNAVDAATLMALSGEDVEIVGPRGTARGRTVLDEWLRRAGLRWTPLRWFGDAAGTVVVEQRANWREIDTGEDLGSAVIAAHFTVAGGRVVRFARYDDLALALRAAGLTEAHEVAGPR